MAENTAAAHPRGDSPPGCPYGLTRRQREALLVIQELEDGGAAPSLSEIGRELDIASPSRVHALVRALRDRGWIDFLPHRARSIRVLRRLPVPIDIELGVEFVGFFEHDLRLPGGGKTGNGKDRACRVCGCTDEWGCDGGCYWVEPDLCSACAAEKDGWPGASASAP